MLYSLGMRTKSSVPLWQSISPFGLTRYTVITQVCKMLPPAFHFIEKKKMLSDTVECLSPLLFRVIDVSSLTKFKVKNSISQWLGELTYDNTECILIIQDEMSSRENSVTENLLSVRHIHTSSDMHSFTLSFHT